MVIANWMQHFDKESIKMSSSQKLLTNFVSIVAYNGVSIAKYIEYDAKSRRVQVLSMNAVYAFELAKGVFEYMGHILARVSRTHEKKYE